jgi:hypothetical protein
MKVQRGVYVRLYSFLNLDATWKWVVNATPPAALPPEKRTDIRCMGG